MSSLFITGATGFLGRSVLRGLAASGADSQPTVLCRSDSGAPAPEVAHVVRGDLENIAAWESALRGVRTVVHLAARTGKASRNALFETNAEGTRRLLDACRRADVERFLLVSTIAATYPDKRVYPYAASKERAEELVRESGLRHAILRPTIVLGPGSPIGRSLCGLAGAPFLPIFGDGRARMQPVHVDDVAKALIALLGRLESDAIVEGAFDLGGPEALSFEEFMCRLARRLKGADARVVHVPVRGLIALLAALEPVLLPLLPVTAGQLSAFVNEGVVHEGDLWSEQAPAMRGIERMIEELALEAGAADHE